MTMMMMKGNKAKRGEGDSSSGESSRTVLPFPGWSGQVLIRRLVSSLVNCWRCDAMDGGVGVEPTEVLTSGRANNKLRRIPNMNWELLVFGGQWKRTGIWFIWIDEWWSSVDENVVLLHWLPFSQFNFHSPHPHPLPPPPPPPLERFVQIQLLSINMILFDLSATVYWMTVE